MGIFTYVARDATTGKAVTVPLLTPETEEETRLFAAGQSRTDLRKEMRQNTSDRAIELKAETDDIATELYAQGLQLKVLPALTPCDGKYSILQHQTRLENTLVCQQQQTNMAGAIFGGFLMRRAFEIAYSTAYMTGGVAPRFKEFDHVTFRSPVNVGDLLSLTAHAIYTRGVDEIVKEEQDVAKPGNTVDVAKFSALGPEIIVRVEARVTRPEMRNSTVSNVFYLTFSAPGVTNVAKVLPGEFEHAQTTAERIVDDRHQRVEDREDGCSFTIMGTQA